MPSVLNWRIAWFVAEAEVEPEVGVEGGSAGEGGTGRDDRLRGRVGETPPGPAPARADEIIALRPGWAASKSERHLVQLQFRRHSMLRYRSPAHEM